VPPPPPRTPAEPPEAGAEGRSGVDDHGRRAGPAGQVGLPRRQPVPFRRAVNGPGIEASKEARRREADEDRELIHAAQKGDKLAFRRLVDRHQRRAFVLAVGLVRDENDARELVQEAFLRVHRGLAAFQGGSAFFTWLYRIITNLAIDLMRKPGRRDVGLDEEHPSDDPYFPLVSRIDGADPLDVMRRREIAARIQAGLQALPDYHRGVILLREVEGMSYEEIAEAMGVSKGTIMSRLFHARQKLQRALADCYAEENPPPKSDAAEPLAESHPEEAS
jgi:RNA polymerase sigma-70 factor (ECF subfamily)